MFKKLQINLTLICTIITSVILVLTSTIALRFFQKNLYTTEYNTFTNNAASCYSYIQSQETLSLQWLTQSEYNGNYSMYIAEKNTPLKITEFHTEKEYTQLVDKCIKIGKTKYSFDIKDTEINPNIYTSIDFTTSFKNEKYFISLGVVPKGESYVSVVLMHPLDNYYKQLYRQIVFYILIDFVAIILLSIFSYLFSKKAISPIVDSKKRQDRFIAAASHELRSPLAVILSSASALKKTKTKEESSRFIDTINAEGNRMSNLINDMLLLASANAKSWSINLNEEEIDTIVIDSYEYFELMAKEKSITFKLNIEDTSFPRYICDKERIIQVLSILINNAFNYCPKNGKVILKLQLTSSYIEILVIDNGIGISDSDKTHIFEPFYRADNSRNSKNNFGLGLSIAYEIIKLHKGDLSVSDTIGGGTTFSIKLFL